MFLLQYDNVSSLYLFDNLNLKAFHKKCNRFCFDLLSVAFRQVQSMHKKVEKAKEFCLQKIVVGRQACKIEEMGQLHKIELRISKDQ